MTRTALILMPGTGSPWEASQARAAFELWWQGAAAVAYGTTDAAALPVPAERVCHSLFSLRLWLVWRRIQHIVVAGPGATELAARLSARRVAALPLRIA